LVFLIFGLAVFENQRAVAAETAVSQTISPDSATKLKRAADSLRHLTDARNDSLRALSKTTDSLRGILFGKFPPDCEPKANPPEWSKVRFVGGGKIRVVVERGLFGFEPGQTIELPANEFVARFAEAHRLSTTRGCRFRVSVEDTQETTKNEFKRLLAVVQSIFRPQGYLR
jgi:hypothetical protein